MMRVNQSLLLAPQAPPAAFGPATNARLNILLSGVSVSGDMDTTPMPVKIEMGDSDKVGHTSFALQNTQGAYSKVLVSGNALLEMDVVANGISTVLWKGTVERAEPQIDAKVGSFTAFDAYDFGRELQNAVSPDARQPYLLATGGGVNILSGDGGIATPSGMDLVIYTSGADVNSGCTVSQFMGQWFGVSGDPSGSQSGLLLTFKPYVSGAIPYASGTNTYASVKPWRTFYVPDSSDGTLAKDNNSGFRLPIERIKVKHEYAWDALRKITRQQLAIDKNGNPVSFEMFVGVSGDLHIFTSGSYEILSSGLLIYYAAGQSGASLNNIVSAKVPFDLTAVKNFIDGWFRDQTLFPLDGDFWTDIVVYSGGYWTNPSYATSFATQKLSGNAPAPGATGFISIEALSTGGATAHADNYIAAQLAVPGAADATPILNAQQWNISGVGIGVSLQYNMRVHTSGTTGGLGLDPIYHNVRITGSGGANFIMKSGTTAGDKTSIHTGTDGNSEVGKAWDVWRSFSQPLYSASGVFLSGTGRDGGWKESPAGVAWYSGLLTNIEKIEMGVSVATGADTPDMAMMVDQVRFVFDYQFSPVTAFNSGSQGMYGRRYAVVEWPYQVTANGASGVINAELQNRMGSQGLATFVVKDNPLMAIGPQLSIKPGYVFVVDAPTLATGSGQPFYYWRASAVTHIWTKKDGFETTIKAYPWYSGTLAAPNTNYIGYRTPIAYSTGVPPPEHESFAPISRPWHGPSG